jgi:hypothetical protein
MVAKFFFLVENGWRLGFMCFHRGLKGWSAVVNVACEIQFVTGILVLEHMRFVCVLISELGLSSGMTNNLIYNVKKSQNFS